MLSVSTRAMAIPAAGCSSPNGACAPGAAASPARSPVCTLAASPARSIGAGAAVLGIRAGRLRRRRLTHERWARCRLARGRRARRRGGRADGPRSAPRAFLRVLPGRHVGAAPARCRQRVQRLSRRGPSSRADSIERFSRFVKGGCELERTLVVNSSCASARRGSATALREPLGRERGSGCGRTRTRRQHRVRCRSVARQPRGGARAQSASVAGRRRHSRECRAARTVRMTSSSRIEQLLHDIALRSHPQRHRNQGVCIHEAVALPIRDVRP
jgi:hypothetical protein